MRYTYVCLWLIGSVMAGQSHAQVAADSFDLEQCVKARDALLAGASPAVRRAMQGTADEHYARCVTQAQRDAQARADNAAGRRVSAEIARQKREEYRAELRRCMPRGDCNDEYLRSLAEEAVDRDFDARYGR
ncbi:hypothetical protein BCR16_12525 [Ralstonia solanacearum FJAT-1458]|nr:hypothetical protein BCR16_12525 [Ralstonia solanacearum FJAT-1458]